MSTVTEIETRTLEVPGGTIQCDVRGDLDTAGPHRVLVLAGYPMDATGFGTLASYFTDRPVVTYDPRPVGRSTGAPEDRPLTPEDHAEDLHRVIEALGVGPVDLFGSSGGAVNSLALVARHPDQVATLVAHEPPLASVLPDREPLLSACADIHDTYESAGMGPAMAKFIALVQHKGELPPTYGDQPAPDPGAFGLPTDDDGSRDDPMLGQSIRTIPQFEPDTGALGSAATRVVIAAGVESEGEMAARGAAALAERLGVELTMFPSHHGGFLGGEFGQRGDPDGFAGALRTALDND
jgi:pimeloyl-ACP methyl ester carboxylesterase